MECTKDIAAANTPLAVANILPIEIKQQLNGLLDATITGDGSVVLGEVVQGISLTIFTPASVVTTKDLKLTNFDVKANKIAFTKSICAEDTKLRAQTRIDNLARLVSKKLDIHSVKHASCILRNHGEIATKEKSKISVGSVYNYNKIIATGELYTAAKKYWLNKPGASLITTGPVGIHIKKPHGCTINSHSGIINFGQIISHDKCLLNSMGLIVNRVGGIIRSRHLLNIVAKTFINSGHIHSRAGTKITCDSRNCVINTLEGAIDSDQYIDICGNGPLNNYGKIKGHETVAIRLSGDLTNLEKANISADLRLILSSAHSIINEANIASHGNFDVISSVFSNREAGVITADAFVQITSFDSLYNAGKINAREIKAYVGSLFQTATGELHSDSSAKVTTWKSVHNAGSMRAALNLLIKCYGEIANVASGKIYAGRLLALDAQQLANEGTLESKQSLLLKAIIRLSQSPAARALAQQSLTMLSSGDLYLAGELTSHGMALLKASEELVADSTCTITSAESLKLIADGIIISATIKNEGQLLLKAVHQLTQFAEGKIEGKNVRIEAKAATNSGSVVATEKLEIELSNSFTNLLTGILQAGTTLTLTANMAENNGTVQAFGKMQAQIANTFLNLQQGKIISKQDLLITAGMVLENAGKIAGDASVSLEAAAWFKQLASGKITAGNFTLDTRILDNFGTIDSQHKLHITATTTLQNYTQGKISAKEALTLLADSLINAGELKSDIELFVKVDHILENYKTGKLMAAKAIDLVGATIVVNAGKIAGLGTLTSQVQICLTNLSDASMTAAKALNMLSDFAVQNRGFLQAEQVCIRAKQFLELEETSLVQASKGASLTSSGSINQIGAINAPQIVVASDWLMNGGTMQATSLNIDCQEAITNLHSGKITIEQVAAIVTKQGFINLGNLLAKEKLSVIAKQISQCGTIGAVKEIYLKALDLMLHGDVQAGGNLLAIIDGDFTYETVSVKANGDITLVLKNGYTVVMPINTPGGLKIELTKANGELINLTAVVAGKDLTIDAPGCIIVNGNKWLPKAILQSEAGATRMVGQEFQNVNGTAFSQRETVIAVQENITNSEASRIASSGDVKLYSITGTLVNHGKLEIGKLLEIIVAGKLEIIDNIEAQDIFLQSVSNDVEIISKVTRTGNTENFSDTVKRLRIAAKGILTILAGKNVVFGAVETKSELNTYIGAVANIIDQPVYLVQQRIQHLYGQRSGTIRDTKSVPVASLHESTGDITKAAGGNVLDCAPEYKVKNVFYASERGTIEVLDAKAISEHEEHIREEIDRWYGTKVKHIDFKVQEVKSIGAKFEVTGQVIFNGNVAAIVRNIYSLATHNIFNVPNGTVTIGAGENTFYLERHESCSSWVWQSAVSDVIRQTTYSPSIFSGAIEITSKKTILDLVRGKTLEFMQRLSQQSSTAIEHNMLTEEYHHESHRAEGLGIGLGALISLAAGIATAGTGMTIAAGLKITSDIGMAVFAAGFSTICSQTVVSMLANEGNIFKAIESLTQTAALKSLATAMISAGVMNKIAGALKLPKGSELKTLEQHLQYNLARASINTVLGIGINGQDEKAGLISGLTNAAVGTVSEACAQKVGQLYQPGKSGSLDPLSHKILHGVIGGASGAVLAKEKGVVAGAIGAVVAETVADVLKPDPTTIQEQLKSETGTTATVDAFVRLYSADIEKTANCSKLAAATVAFLTQQDVSLAIQAASNAIENNFMQSANREMVAASSQLVLQRELELIRKDLFKGEKQLDFYKKQLQSLEEDPNILLQGYVFCFSEQEKVYKITLDRYNKLAKYQEYFQGKIEELKKYKTVPYSYKVAAELDALEHAESAILYYKEELAKEKTKLISYIQEDIKQKIYVTARPIYTLLPANTICIAINGL
jgi:adhesin HecA-like repeat protein